MRNKWIVCILILTLLMGPFAANTSTAGGGGGCSGEDEKQCLAAVWGTAAVLIIGVYLVSRYAGDKKPEAAGKQPQAKEALPTDYQVDSLEEKQVTALISEIEDKVAQNGDIIIWKW
jgi:hypothetical protein